MKATDKEVNANFLSVGIGSQVGELLGQAIEDLQEDPKHLSKGIHQARKKMKRIRAALRLMRPEWPELYQKTNALVRDIARDLSAPRDHDARLIAVEKLGDRYPKLAEHSYFNTFLEMLSQSPKMKSNSGSDQLQSIAMSTAGQLSDLRSLMSGWDVFCMSSKDEKKAFHRAVKKARKSYFKALGSLQAEHMHEWRKQSKYLLNQFEFLRQNKPKIQKQKKTLAKLSEQLGEVQDIELLKEYLEAQPHNLPSEFKSLLRRAIEKREKNVHKSAFALGEKLFSADPKQK
jgi:CHAD domain-containing protein